MRHINTVLFGLVASSMLLAVGCTQADDAENVADTTLAETSAKNVSLSLKAKGSADVWVKLHVISKITAQEVSTQSVHISGGSTASLKLGLDVDTDYTFKADVYADAQLSLWLGSKSTDCSVDKDYLAELSLLIDASIQGSAGITWVSNHAPKIDNVLVQLNTALDVAASLKVVASGIDSASSKLHYFWTGFCIDGTIEGSSSLNISVDTALKALAKGGDHHIFVLVQDELGASVSQSIDLALNLNVGVGLGLGLGSGSGPGCNTGKDLSLNAELEVCLDAHASCAASCNLAACSSPSGAALLVSCMAKCGVDLATCESTCY